MSTRFYYGICETVGIVLAVGMVLTAAGCGVHPNSSWIGSVGAYNYSPSVIQTGKERQVWWCGEAENPADHSRHSDSIRFESINLSADSVDGPRTVLAETSRTWDSAYTCNPRVIAGIFNNPFGDGHSYKYAMYYVGTADLHGMGNGIGVAFSQDGISWRKYPKPIIQDATSGNYGPGQPAAYNADGKSAVTLLYEDSDSTISHIEATSTDGIHFTVQGTLTSTGLDPDDPQASWGDIAYDTKTHYWYALFNRQLRAPSTTGNVVERGQLGVELYRIPASSLLTGTTPWQQLDTIDTNLTGYESNFIAGFVHDAHGNLIVGSSSDIDMYVAESSPQPSWDTSPGDAANTAQPPNWVIHLEKWNPDASPLPLYQYFNGKVHEVTTGWIDPSGGFHQKSLLGHLEQAPLQGADLALYGCKRGSSDYFVSLDSACEGQRILGRDGYGYSRPIAGLQLVGLYRCSTGHDHFVSQSSGCDGQKTDEFLGYALP